MKSIIATILFLLTFSFVQAQTKNILDYQIYSASGDTFTVGGLAQQKPIVIFFMSTKCKWSEFYNDRFNEYYTNFNTKVFPIFLSVSDDASWNDVTKLVQSNYYTFNPYREADKKITTDFGVSKTPSVCIFSADGNLIYKGRIDNTPREYTSIIGSFVQNITEKMLSGEPVKYSEQNPLVGCDLPKPPAPPATPVTPSNGT